MKYNLNDVEERNKAKEYWDKLWDGRKVVELKEVRKYRTLNQNNYLHLLLGAFGLNFGYTVEESKQIFKRLSKDIFYYEKSSVNFLKSTAELDTKEMSTAIDRFMDYSAEHGYSLPLATDEAWLREISNQIERESRWV